MLDDYLEARDKMQEAVLHSIHLLMMMNPEENTAEGRLLKDLAIAQSKYEREIYPNA